VEIYAVYTQDYHRYESGLLTSSRRVRICEELGSSIWAFKTLEGHARSQIPARKPGPALEPLGSLDHDRARFGPCSRVAPAQKLSFRSMLGSDHSDGDDQLSSAGFLPDARKGRADRLNWPQAFQRRNGCVGFQRFGAVPVARNTIRMGTDV